MIRFACRALMAGALLITGLSVTGCSGSDQPECAPGQFYDANMQMCVAANQQCPPGQMWNGSMCAQGGGAAPQCPAGQTWNGSACVGGAPPPQQCPAGQSWNGSACVPAQNTGGGACNVSNMGGAGGPVADQAIKALASQHIPAGARAVGGAMVGNFQAGQCMETAIQVQAGKCYTVVGAALAGGDLDIELIPSIGLPGMPSAVVAQDQTDGPQAVLGGKPNCWTALVPGPMKLRIRLEGGAGMAGAQLYEK